MANDLFERTDELIKAIRSVALGIALAIVAIFLLYFIGMTAWRLGGLLRRCVFGHPWGI